MTTKPQPPAANGHTPDHSIKETIESIVVAFILAFVFRAFVVEAFVIPTGSMAPTLLGAHMDLRCPMCGHEFSSGPWNYGRAHEAGDGRFERPAAGIQGPLNTPAGQFPLRVECPMCGYPVSEDAIRTKPGDRILVLKYVYGVSEPERWDVVVFRNPESPTINYIKRLVGLPNERLELIRGNVYTRPRDPANGAFAGGWRVQRKPADVQRAVWQPVYHSRYVPLDAAMRPWSSPWTSDANEPLSPIDHGHSFDYAGGEAATLRFDFAADDRTGRDYYPYNVLPEAAQGQRPRPGAPLGTHAIVEDMRLAVTIEPERDAAVTLHLAGDLFQVRGVLGTDATARLMLGDANDDDSLVTVAEAADVNWSPGEAARVELWQVDHAVSLWVNGDEVARYELDLVEAGESTDAPVTLTMDRLVYMGRPRRMPRASVEVAGSAARLREVKLDRDLYYTNSDLGGVPLGTHDQPADLGPGEFFCLGDNSPQSKDSRRWEGVNDWITYHTRADHQHLALDGQTIRPGVKPGIVPRKLMIGRAFFVYFPSPEGLNPTGFPLVVNFGDLRFIE